MKKTFFTVGPSQIYPTVPSHIQKAIKNDILSISHRGQEFQGFYKEAVDGLRKLLNIPPDYQIVFVSSALEAMERVLQAMSHNDSFHILTGFFGKTWLGISKDLAKSPQSFQFFNWDTETVADEEFENIKIPKETELVCITQNDTSVGFSIPMEKIYALKRKYPKKLFALDIVSSAPFVDIEYKYLDAVFFSVQKGFGLPAGLCALILSPNAMKQAQKLSKRPGYSIGSYHNLVKLAENSEKFQTVETPNVLGIYLLSELLKDYLKIGIKTLRKQTLAKAQVLYSFFSKPEYYKDTLPMPSGIGSAFVNLREYQSITTPVFEIKQGSGGLRKFAAEKGLILGAGYKDFKEKHLRIANFPALTIEDTEKLIEVLKKFKN